jgi:ABC-2 type transport system permease protein
MVATLLKKELQQLAREKTFRLVAVLLFFLLVTALFVSAVNLKQLNRERIGAQQMSREGWLMQPPKNPHSAAHFGNFAFRIKSPLSLFDNGLDTYTGTSLFLEPHKQNGDKFSQAEESTSLIRFGELTPAMVLQTILPLLIIFVCFASVSGEKEGNTLKLLLTQGGSIPKIVTGKILAYWLAFATVLVPFFLITVAVLSGLQSGNTTQWSRLLLLMISYIIYAGIWISISVVVSAWSANSRGALMKLLGAWMLAVIILPKLSANAGNVLYRTPSQFQFTQAVNKDVNEGLDGHNPYDKRRAALLTATMKKYNVTREEDLPVNFDAVAMIESENYTTEVFRKRRAEVDAVFRKQNRISEATAFLNPAQAMQYSSMALCGTDYAHYTDFQNQAEDYRLYFVNTMNEYMSTRTKAGDWSTKFGRESYELVKPFYYREASIGFALKNQPFSFAALLCWFTLCVLFVLVTRKIKLLQ